MLRKSQQKSGGSKPRRGVCDRLCNFSLRVGLAGHLSGNPTNQEFVGPPSKRKSEVA